MISTKGRYALRVFIDLAEQDSPAPVPLKDIARRQQISGQYLQHIVKLMVDAGLLIGTSGKGGGYRMTRPADQCTVGEVLEAAEGTLAPVACLVCGTVNCDQSDSCKALPLWQRFDTLSRDFFASVTIADLATGKVGMPS